MRPNNSVEYGEFARRLLGFRQIARSEGAMGPTIVVVAAGEMGAASGQRLRLRGATVRTSRKGRSAAAGAGAKAAGLVDIDNDAKLVEGADFVLSVMPPGEAKNLARRLASALTA